MRGRRAARHPLTLILYPFQGGEEIFLWSGCRVGGAHPTWNPGGEKEMFGRQSPPEWNGTFSGGRRPPYMELPDTEKGLFVIADVRLE